jgi:methylenetetrahydrofolate reductase (NADPH)
MPKICDLIAEKAAAGEDWVSYEYFPPRSEQGVKNLEARFLRMKQARMPLFCDMTWGAGGSTSDLTMELTLKIKSLGLEPNMHLTCTNVAREDVVKALHTCRQHGVRNIVALRGDPPVGQDKWEATEGGFECALDLVKFIREEHGDYFCLSVAGYPEGHPDTIVHVGDDEAALSPSERTRCKITVEPDGAKKVYVCPDASFKLELDYLKRKVAAGADVIITQMFFDASTYGAFLRECRAAGITVPVVPGIMLVQAAGGFRKMTTMCKTRVPGEVHAAVDARADDDAELKSYGVDLGVAMSHQLLAYGAPGLHFYTLNLEKSTLAIADRVANARAKTKSAKRDLLMRAIRAAGLAAGVAFAVKRGKRT